jgi:predicted DNA-binding WGR domain protein
MKFTYGQFRSLLHEAMLNAYEVLGVGRNATPDEIKAAWRDMAIKNHPDRVGGDLEKMKNVNVARDILNTPRLKNKLDYELGSQQASTQSPFTSARSREREEREKRDREYYAADRERARQASRGRGTQAPGHAWRRFEYINIYERSQKFWEVNVDGRTMNVKWGRIGSQGQSKAKMYDDAGEAYNASQTLIRQKLVKGYKEVTRSTQHTPKPGQGSRPRTPPSASSSGKKTYKVYGRVRDPKSQSGGSDVHTRVKNTVYTPRDFRSRARQNQQVNVNVRDDGRLGVSDPSGDWSQVWDRNESVELKELVLCELVKLVEVRKRELSLPPYGDAESFVVWYLRQDKSSAAKAIKHPKAFGSYIGIDDIEDYFDASYVSDTQFEELGLSGGTAKEAKETYMWALRNGFHGDVDDMPKLYKQMRAYLRGLAPKFAQAYAQWLKSDHAEHFKPANESDELVEARERDKSGKYKHWDDWDRLCVCGHKLGVHAAEKVGNERPCFYGDEHPDEFCDCMLFKPAKRGRD